MIELVIVSRLLEYPDAALWRYSRRRCSRRSRHQRNSEKRFFHALGVFLRDLVAQDPLDAQAAYSEPFDRGRATSLLLFEHVHGESPRSRAGGWWISWRSTSATACCWIAMSRRIIRRHIWSNLGAAAGRGSAWRPAGRRVLIPSVRLLSARLQQRESRHAVLFELLLKLANTQVDSRKVAEKIADEARDDTPQALDASLGRRTGQILCRPGLRRVRNFRSPASFCRSCGPAHI
ncbi:nitrate reductase molybdenum cofactor assembly chaperone [Klebsiella pneumoniae]|nr:nitrate reductase molybdenum cofactor assembly chaperone [Klebsiella pneumoniae]